MSLINGLPGRARVLPGVQAIVCAGLFLAQSLAVSVTCAQDTGAASMLDNELQALLDLVPGRYAGRLADTGERSGEGRIFHTIERVSLPEFGDEVLLHVVSLQGFDDPQPFQQKFYTVDLDASRERNRMRSVVMMNAPRWKPGAMPDDSLLIRFPESCAIGWRQDGDRFIARVKRGDCVYESKGLGGAIVPDMTYVVTADSFSIRDVLYRPDGTQITPGGDMVTAARVTQASPE